MRGARRFDRAHGAGYGAADILDAEEDGLWGR